MHEVILKKYEVVEQRWHCHSAKAQLDASIAQATTDCMGLDFTLEN